MTASRDEARPSVFEDLRSRTQQAVESGHLAEAEALANEALAWARRHGSPNQIDQAICNRAALVISKGQGEVELPALRKILVRSSSPANAWLAAYNIARHYEAEKLFGKSLFYARIARDRARSLGSREWQAASHNQIGSALLAESCIGEASREYEEALALLPAENVFRRAAVLVNLGYCRVLQGRFREGYALIYECLALERKIGSRRYELIARLDLCFAHLETGRYRYALRHGRAALALALQEESAQGTQGIKNALYLLGEACSLSGDRATAEEYFTRLQRDFFPGAGYLPGFLLSVDVRKLVNLHA